MSDVVRVPSTGNSDEDSIVAQVVVAKGQTVTTGQVLLLLETAKAEVEVTAPRDGVVLRIAVTEGDEVPPFHPIMWIGEEGEIVEDAPDSPAEDSSPTTPQAPDTRADDQQVVIVSAQPVQSPTTEIVASPRAKLYAERNGIDLSQIVGSGPGGRVIMPDVLSVSSFALPLPAQESNAPANLGDASAFTLVPHTRARKVTAKRMHESLMNTAQLTLTRYVSAEVITAFRQRWKEVAGEEGFVPSINDLIMFAVARAITKVPDINSHYGEDGLKVFTSVNLGFAVDTPSGLFVPVIQHADKLSLRQLSKRARDLATAAKEGSLGVADMSGGTFTVTNLGALGVGFFTPVLNPPESGILGVGAATSLVPGAPPVIPLSLTFDHRSLDGAGAARALDAIAHAIEHIDVVTHTA
jgi:pyruvate dehydrogenase E2 component (dihydrolipoamide acetyltransferase)